MTETTDRFTVEISEGTADHIIDMNAEGQADASFWAPDRITPGELMCSRGNRLPESERVSLTEYAAHADIEEGGFNGDPPEGICSYSLLHVQDQFARRSRFPPT